MMMLLMYGGFHLRGTPSELGAPQIGMKNFTGFLPSHTTPLPINLMYWKCSYFE